MQRQNRLKMIKAVLFDLANTRLLNGKQKTY